MPSVLVTGISGPLGCQAETVPAVLWLHPEGLGGTGIGELPSTPRRIDPPYT